MAGNYLDALFGRFYVDGVEQELVGGINVKSPLTATVNNETGALDVSLTIEAAAQVPYDNDASELSAANVQAALDELAAAVDAIGGDLAATGIADVLAVDDDAGGASIEGLGFVGVTAADHETAALTIASGGGGGASSAWSIGSAVPSHAPGVGAHHVRVASSDDSALYVRHAAGWVPYIRGNLNAGRVPYTLNSTGRVTSSSNLAFDGTNLSIAEPTADAHAATRAYVNKRSFSASGVSWTAGTNNGTADVQIERSGNVVALRVVVTASGSTGQSIVSAVGFLPEWARPSATLANLSNYSTADNTIFGVEALANGQVVVQKRLISSSGITHENWTASEERTLVITYPVPAV